MKTLTMFTFVAISVVAGGSAEAVHIRRDAYSLTPAQVTSLRKAVTVMKARQASDPTSWLYQANIHGTNDAGSKPAWNSCQHGSYLFLSWHRMYLYWFERIMRKASGDVKFALPYWNYSVPAQAALPVIYRVPGNATNSLFLAQRNAGINAGNALPPSVTSFAVAFASTAFSTPQGNGNSFGGQRVPAPRHLASPHGLIESQPHDIVHVTVGGFMGQVNLAARDPIFWAHHANIDRLWKRWLRQGGGRADPGPGDTVWRNTRFTFFNENGQQVTMTGADILNTVAQLDYRYDDEPFIALPGSILRAAAAEPTRTSELLAASAAAEPTKLTGRSQTLSVALPAESKDKITAASAEDAPKHVMLNIEGIRYKDAHNVAYEVYVNLPADKKNPDAVDDAEHFVGTLALFALAPHHAGEEGGDEKSSRTYDISAIVQALKDAGSWQDGNLSVTLKPVQLVSPKGEPVEPLAASAADLSDAQFDRISVTVE